MDVLKFTLEVSLGNEDMQTSNDVSWLLHELSDKLCDGPPLKPAKHNLFDDNGNSVGYWEVTS